MGRCCSTMPGGSRTASPPLWWSLTHRHACAALLCAALQGTAVACPAIDPRGAAFQVASCCNNSTFHCRRCSPNRHAYVSPADVFRGAAAARHLQRRLLHQKEEFLSTLHHADPVWRRGHIHDRRTDCRRCVAGSGKQFAVAAPLAPVNYNGRSLISLPVSQFSTSQAATA